MTKVVPMCAALLLLVVGLTAFQAHAGCRYPAADGGEPHPSAPNVVGKVAKIDARQIVLHTKAGNRTIRVPDSGTYYTAFGGDGPLGRLKPGLVARAWYEGCKSPKGKTMPAVAYLEVYSNDPNDHPPSSYWERY